jgi:voltage-gated potassium channel
MSFFRKIFQKWAKIWQIIRSSDFITAIFVIVMVLTFGTLGISIFEIGINEQFESWGSSLWWSIVTTTTVGYGDKVPVSLGGKIVAGFIILAGIASFSLFTASVSSMLVAKKIREGKGLEEIKSKNHILICGWNYNCESILNSLLSYSSQIDIPDIVMVNNLEEEASNDLLYRYKQLNLKFVKGDFASESVLIRAGIKNAEATIILPDLSSPTRANADEKTVLVTLSIKSIAPKLRVYAHVLDKSSAGHLKRANATGIIVSDEFSGFLLMSHIIFPGIPQTVSEILSSDSDHVLNRLAIPNDLKGKSFKELSDHFKDKGNSTVIALIKETDSVQISDILVGDYSFLDEFIERKFREAGRGLFSEEQVFLNVNPANDHVINEEKYVIAITNKKSN